MSDLERRLRDGLTARAGTVRTDDDWEDLLERSARRGRRTSQTLAAALAITLIVGAVGVAVAATRASSDRAVVSTKDKVVTTGAHVPTLGLAPANQPTFGSARASSEALTTSGSLGVASATIIAPFLPQQNMAKVFTRTTAAGVVIRGYRANVSSSNLGGGPPWWTPAAGCFPDGYVQADVSDDAIADATTAPIYKAASDGTLLRGSVSEVGRNEKSPRWVVIARSTSAARIRADFGGATDEMATVDGVAILVGPAGSSIENAKVHLTALDASGATIARTDAEVSAWALSFGTLKDGCVAPTALPAPGAEQPADANAARADITTLWNATFQLPWDTARMEAGFDDSHGFDEVIRALQNGSFKDAVNSAAMKLDNLVFLSATTAAIQYQIETSTFGTFSNRFTEAHLVDGHWKLARQGWCNDVAMAGEHCPD